MIVTAQVRVDGEPVVGEARVVVRSPRQVVPLWPVALLPVLVLLGWVLSRL